MTWPTPTRLAGQLDPEDLREVVLAYQATCVESSSALTGMLLSIWAMVCWCTLAIRRPMKMMLSGLSGLVWASSMP